MVMLKLEDQSPLIQAIFSGEYEDVRNVLDSKPDVNYQDVEKRSPLHAAAFKGDRDLTELLLLQGARVNAKDSKWLTPLHRACGVGSEDTVEVLLKHKADTTARDRQWQTPLHIAAANNALECVTQLISYVPNVNVTDRSGRTALHHAALNGHNDVVEALIVKGCIVNACDKKDCRPIHWAAHLGHVDTVEMLIRNGADINVKDRNQYTPLHVAAASGMVYACRLLINAGATVDAQNSYGNTPLHIACLNGHLPVCQELIGCGANLEAVNYRGQTPLHIAAASTHGVGCLSCLLEHNVDINKQSSDGRTPLHMSAIHGRFTRSKTLIDQGAIIDCQDKNGNTALHIAAQFGHDILTATLLGYGADPTKRGYEGRTPLHACCLSGFVEVSRKFLSAKLDLNTRDDTGKTFIHCAAYKGSVECLDLIVSQGGDFKLQDNIGRTALHYAAVRGHYNCVFTLVGIGSPVNVVDSEGCSALHLAAAYDLEGKCVEYLLQHKADAKLKDNRGFTPVHYAVNGTNSHALEFLLQTFAKNYVFNEPDMPPTTPLHLAARSGDLNILRSIMPYFPDTNIKNETGCTPLLIAAREGHTHCVQMLLRYGAKVGICEDIYKMSPVHYSAKNGHMHCLALLVDNAEDKTIIDRQDKFNRTALMLAVSSSHKDCVLTLLKSDSDPNIIDSDKHSSLFRAVVTDQNNVVQVLITKGASVSTADVNGKTPLHLAAACGHFSCLKTILQHIAEATALDNHNFSALHWACYFGNAMCVEHLVQKDFFKVLDGNPFSPVHCAAFSGSERCLETLYNKYGEDIIKLVDTRKRTPMHISALHGHTEFVRCLLEKGAAIDVRDEMGRTPLVAAAQNGQSQIIELLISHKADLKLCDNNGNTALHMACLKRHSHSALLLLECVNDVEIINMTNLDRKTSLHLAARNGLVEVTRNLIKKGSSVLAVDSNGLTPALCCAPNASVAQCLAIILANHPLQCPTNNHSTNKEIITIYEELFKTFDRKPSQHSEIQTKVSLIRNSNELIDDLLRKARFPESSHRNKQGRRHHLHQSNPHHHIKPDKAEIICAPKASLQTDNILIIEQYDKSDEFDEGIRQSTGQGLGLHRSFSDIALVGGEDKKRKNEYLEQESTVKKLISGYKIVARKMVELTKMYDVNYTDVNQVFINHCNQQNIKRSLLLNRHVQNYNDVFKCVSMRRSKALMEKGKPIGAAGEGLKLSSLLPQVDDCGIRMKKKKCGCQYVCEKCVTRNIYDLPESDEEELKEVTFHDCIEVQNVEDNVDDLGLHRTPVTKLGINDEIEATTVAIEEIPSGSDNVESGPSKQESQGAISKHSAFRRSNTRVGLERFQCTTKTTQLGPEVGADVWPKITIDSGMILIDEEIKKAMAEEQKVKKAKSDLLFKTARSDSDSRKTNDVKYEARKCGTTGKIEVDEIDNVEEIERIDNVKDVESAEIAEMRNIYAEMREEVLNVVSKVTEGFMKERNAQCEMSESQDKKEIKILPPVLENKSLLTLFLAQPEMMPKNLLMEQVSAVNLQAERTSADNLDEADRNDDKKACLRPSSNSHESFLQREPHLGPFSMHFGEEVHSQNSSDNEYY